MNEIAPREEAEEPTSRDGRRVQELIAMLAAVLGAIAAVVLYFQAKNGQCDWSSAVYDWDSSHAYVDGEGPSGKLLLACPLLLTVAAVSLIRKLWVVLVVALPIWVAIFIAMLVLLPHPCSVDNEPAATASGLLFVG